ncbi:hypothetical protein M3Y98_00032200 [Aphelenchoides besseyi]|nr:hypothetical protein M3Y98_00032200 [Aphelenchoides besseyi]KAI6199359.1 hypothetical protein M3Y96_00618700 [Aphelenchoides besseyi]
MNVQNVEEERRPEEETEASSRNVVNIRIDEDEEEEDERNESPIDNFFNDFSTPSRSNDNNDSIDFIFGTPSDAQTPPNSKPKAPKRSLPATLMRSENPQTESPFGGLNLDDIGNDGLFNLSNNLFGSQNDEGPGFSIGSGVDASPGGLFPSMNSPHTTSPFNFNTSHNKDNSPQPFFDF